MLSNVRRSGRSIFGISSEFSKSFVDVNCVNPTVISFRRWIRGSRRIRYDPKGIISGDNVEGKAMDHGNLSFDDDRGSGNQFRQQTLRRSENPRFRNDIDGRDTFRNEELQSSENVITSPRIQSEFPDPRIKVGKNRKGKFIKDRTVYGTQQGNKIAGDPFLSGPYPKTVRKVGFEHGNSAAEESVRRQIDPASTSIVIFPGQGAQYVGMSGPPESLPRYVQVLYEIASSILDIDLLDLCANGPREKLDKTIYCQPAILVSSLAALEKLRESNPQSIESCVATAGFSVGEIAALVFSGAVTFEDGVRLVKVRSEAMQLASEIVPSGMATVMYGADSKLNYSLMVAKEWCAREYNIENPVCSVANYLFPHCKVVAGNKEALEFLEINYKDFKLRKIRRLPVSGAFHTDIMRPAAEPVKAMMQKMTISKPRMPVFSNVTGLRYRSSDDVKRFLPQQIYKPVLWEQCIQAIYQRPKETEYPVTFECGPGSSLKAVMKMVNAKAALKTSSILPFDVPVEPLESEVAT